MLPLYAARIEDLGHGDLIKIGRAANADRAAEGRTEPSRKGSRPQRAVPVPRVREERASGRFDQVAAARRTVHFLTAGPHAAERGAGFVDHAF